MAPLPPSETDILFNRHAVALAKSQRLIASWLPPRTTSTPADEPETEIEIAKGKQRAEQEQEPEDLDDAIFTPAPERLGVGAALRNEADGDVRRAEMAGNEKLKMQLLGRDYAKILAKGRRNVDAGKCGASAVATRTRTEKKPRPAQARREGHISHSSDDEGGRSSLGKVKLGGQKRRCEELEDGVVEDEDEDEDGGVRMKKAAAYNADVKLGAKKRGNGYLDEVLADRARRKRKKGRRKDGAVDG